MSTQHNTRTCPTSCLRTHSLCSISLFHIEEFPCLALLQYIVACIHRSLSSAHLLFTNSNPNCPCLSNPNSSALCIGIPATLVHYADSTEEPNIRDMISNEKIDLVVNLPTASSTELKNNFSTRRTAVRRPASRLYLCCCCCVPSLSYPLTYSLFIIQCPLIHFTSSHILKPYVVRHPHRRSHHDLPALL